MPALRSRKVRAFARGEFALIRAVIVGDDHSVFVLSTIAPHEGQSFIVGRNGDRAVNVPQNSMRNAAERRNLIQRPNRVVLLLDDVIDVGAVAREGQSLIRDFGRRDDSDVIRFGDLPDEQALFSGLAQDVDDVFAVGEMAARVALPLE